MCGVQEEGGSSEAAAAEEAEPLERQRSLLADPVTEPLEVYDAAAETDHRASSETVSSTVCSAPCEPGCAESTCRGSSPGLQKLMPRPPQSKKGSQRAGLDINGSIPVRMGR